MGKADREHERAKKALRAAVAGALKTQARSNGWRAVQGRLFAERDGWFLDVHAGPWVMKDQTTAEFRAKPMALDPLFWEIVKTPDNNKQPLSFRLLGAWTCQGPYWSETQITEGVDPDDIAARILEWSNAQADSPPFSYDVNALAKFIEGQLEGRGMKGAWLAELVSLLALAGRLDEARDFCVAAIERGEHGGYSIGPQSFPELALEWVANRPPPTKYAN
jgi:hypothetical protein